jgi:hypothetical protein
MMNVTTTIAHDGEFRTFRWESGDMALLSIALQLLLLLFGALLERLPNHNTDMDQGSWG